jgi:hypothetical protein
LKLKFPENIASETTFIFSILNPSDIQLILLKGIIHHYSN